MRHFCAIVFFLTSIPVQAFDTTFSSTDRFLKRHVCDGGVNYQTARDDALLDTVMNEFASLSAADFSGYKENVRLAALINLYNVATIKRITGNLPLKSIRDIPAAWSRKWIDFGEATISLDQIEHEIIRKQFDEPRIHFALVCAAKSCPALRIGAYTPGGLDTQLKEAAVKFLTDTSKNSAEGKLLRLSAIFQWYGDDFNKRYGSFQKYVLQTLGLDGRRLVRYRTYDWRLNIENCSQ
jgi:hypothetical protein